MRRLLLILSIIINTNLYAKSSVLIEGNIKTKEKVILNEIKDLLESDNLTEHLNEIERRLWNLRIFSQVNLAIENQKLIIKIQERWTTIPIGKFSGGGGTSYYALGLYDINSFGTNTEMGAQYESLNNRPAGVIWLRKPQYLNDRNLKIGFDLWSINRIRFFYNQTDGEDDGALTLQRKRYNGFIEKKFFNDHFNLGLQFDYQEDEISDFGLSDELKKQNTARNFKPDNRNISRFTSFYLDFGQINTKNYLQDGSQLSLKTSIAHLSSEKDSILSGNEMTLKSYKLWQNFNNMNFAWQFKLKSNNYNEIQNLNYLGGFEEVRGYMDGQYYGNATWQNNLELRQDFFENKYGVIQLAAFTDQAKEGEDLQDLTERKEEVLLSSGLGIRLISPKIFRFVGRIDYAQTHTRFVSQGISFGIQQFF
jgi:hypothetical protein